MISLKKRVHLHPFLLAYTIIIFSVDVKTLSEEFSFFIHLGSACTIILTAPRQLLQNELLASKFKRFWWEMCIPQKWAVQRRLCYTPGLNEKQIQRIHYVNMYVQRTKGLCGGWKESGHSSMESSDAYLSIFKNSKTWAGTHEYPGIKTGIVTWL